MPGKLLWTAAACLAAMAGLPSAIAQVEVVSVTGGQIRGSTQGELIVYKGVPFAEPPLGGLRWRDPQPVRAWNGIRDATTFKSPCMQPLSMLVPPGPPPSEDCLYLNVWAPAKTSPDPLPVMVWIHGGAFTAGAPAASLFDGTHFARRGVVLVSVAYRLGAPGFLAHPELSRESGHGSGNYGLADQIAALRWVQENIGSFGGDRDRVTIFGQSAGAGSASLLAASPLARGLFHRVIAQSGGSFAPTSSDVAMVGSRDAAERDGMLALSELGVASIAAARELPAAALIALNTPFRPHFDGHLLPTESYRLYSSGGHGDTPVLLGYNSNDGAMGSRPATPAAFKDQIRNGYGPAAARILAVYPHSTDAEARKAARDVLRDSAFGWNAWTWSRLQSRHGKGKAYLYYFDQIAPRDSMFHSPDGAVHTGEVPYVFGTLDAPASYTQEDRALSGAMQAYWVNFARTGDPNGPGLPLWPDFGSAESEAMVFKGSVPQSQAAPNMPQIRAFDSYFQSLMESQ